MVLLSVVSQIKLCSSIDIITTYNMVIRGQEVHYVDENSCSWGESNTVLTVFNLGYTFLKDRPCWISFINIFWFKCIIYHIAYNRSLKGTLQELFKQRYCSCVSGSSNYHGQGLAPILHGLFWFQSHHECHTNTLSLRFEVQRSFGINI
jgi:hypothetical protein